MNVEIAKIKIGPRFRQDLGSIESLSSSIAEVGLLHPVVLTKDGQLIAGKRRIEAAKALGWTEIPATMIDLKEIIKGEFAENVARKDFTPSEAVAIAETLEPEIREKARERQGTRTDLNIVENFHEVESGKTRDRVAQFVGMSGRTLEKARSVVEAAKEDPTLEPVVQEMDRTGKVEPAYNLICNKWTGDQESYTPANYIEAARSVMGSIDLDPASNDFAQKIVKAKTYYTKEDSGLAKEWRGNIFLNPPYSQPDISLFVDKLLGELTEEQQAILLTNNSTDTNFFHKAAKAASVLCFTKGRISFYKADGITRTSPTNGQTFFYFGKNKDLFVKVFSQFGLMMVAANE